MTMLFITAAIISAVIFYIILKLSGNNSQRR
jgi:hypothetical protein